MFESFTMFGKRAFLTYLLVMVVSSPLCYAASWVGTWGAAPLPPTPAAGPFPATPSFADVTIRQVVRVSVGGKHVRVRFTNEFGTKPLLIGRATIAITDATGEVKPGTQHALTFDGQPGTTIPAAAPLLSDPVELDVAPLSSLSISVYFPEDTGPCTCHQTGMQTSYVSARGDFTQAAFEPQQKLLSRAFISGVEVETAAKAIVVLGDSISDGVGSSVDQNRRWPDYLAERLQKSARHPGWGVVNMGISGNRILSNGFGESALARFDRDVLSVAGATYVIVFEGVNDLGNSFGQPTGPMAEGLKALAPPNKVTSASLIAGYRQLIERAHAKGLKVIGATITPYEGAMYYSAEGERARQAINTWIRTGRAFDGVIDFDAVIRDPAQPSRMKEGFHMGDHLHGSDAGYEAMANSIDLSLLR
jgi:lysophospholipase L1-like esterase